MTPKLKSLLFFLAFVLCSILYYSLEEQNKNNSLSSDDNFATMQLCDMENTDDLEQTDN
ncbi:hypothetical protein NQT66_11825 [Cellulophaga baltica]|uniref:hypothetical protein n=1 Tax=Cellulophaga baltica TaxID=76594 RepID=UPI0021481290|nr:hypothetical protein [Cellulophaga baltica]MCR1025499.1 hypothetical protein [Cellulophaga baltica]